MVNDLAAWTLAQLIAGINLPSDVNPGSFSGEWAEAYSAYQNSNGRGTSSLQSWLGQPGRESIRQAVFAYKPGSPRPAITGHYHLTDYGNAERLADQHATRIRFVKEWDWMAYTAGRWERKPAAAVRAAKQTVRRIYAEASDIEDEKQRKSIASWAMHSEANTRITALLTLAQSEHPLIAEPMDFDRDPFLLNCKNGVLDLRTGKLRPHNASDFMTRMTQCDYDPKANCPTWLNFLDRIFGRSIDMIDFVQRSGGYSLSGDTSEQVMFFCYGSGRNGKSTLLETIRVMLGDYGQQAEISTFLVRNYDAIRNDIARMTGVRFVSALEVGEGRRLNETLVKQVTGQDTITARHLHREFFEFQPRFKLWMAANHKPVIRGTDEAIWRRIRLIPFDVTIPPREIDRKLLSKLLDELPGILAWQVRGFLQWQKIGLKPPTAVIAATKEYRAEMDVIAAFIVDCCSVAPEAKVIAGELYRTYKRWCQENGETEENQRSFGMRLSERNFERDRSNGAFIWRGLGLISNEQAE